MNRFFVLILLVMMGTAGCSWWAKAKTEKTADELAAEGQTYFQEEKYDQAIKSFKKLKDWYPFSVYVKEASLKIADAYYSMESYDEAILAYNDYERMHPNDEKIPYVIYQIGRCDFDRIETVDRDATATRQALKSFQRLVEQFPDSEYADKAKQHIDTCLRNLAAKEMDIARFYFKIKKYKAALNRFAGVVNGYPDVGLHQEAQDYMEKCKTLMAEEQRVAALEAAARLKKETEGSTEKAEDASAPDRLNPADFFY